MSSLTSGERAAIKKGQDPHNKGQHIIAYILALEKIGYKENPKNTMKFMQEIFKDAYKHIGQLYAGSIDENKWIDNLANYININPNSLRWVRDKNIKMIHGNRTKYDGNTLYNKVENFFDVVDQVEEEDIIVYAYEFLQDPKDKASLPKFSTGPMTLDLFKPAPKIEVIIQDQVEERIDRLEEKFNLKNWFNRKCVKIIQWFKKSVY